MQMNLLNGAIYEYMLEMVAFHNATDSKQIILVVTFSFSSGCIQLNRFIP